MLFVTKLHPEFHSYRPNLYKKLGFKGIFWQESKLLHSCRPPLLGVVLSLNMHLKLFSQRIQTFSIINLSLCTKMANIILETNLFVTSDAWHKKITLTECLGTEEGAIYYVAQSQLFDLSILCISSFTDGKWGMHWPIKIRSNFQTNYIIKGKNRPSVVRS